MQRLRLEVGQKDFLAPLRRKTLKIFRDKYSEDLRLFHQWVSMKNGVFSIKQNVNVAI